MLDRTQFNKILHLERIEIDGNLKMRRSVFKGRLDMESAKIGGALLMRNAHFNKPVNLKSLTAHSDLDARSVTLNKLDLTKAQIKGVLWLASSSKKKIEWKGSAPKLTLRNATVGTLRDSEDAWPPGLELEGFTYEHFGKAGRSVFNMRDSDWFVGWLAKDSPYAPQPYWHLVEHLRDAGHDGKAEHILYANRERQRCDSNTSWAGGCFCRGSGSSSVTDTAGAVS